MNKSILVSLTVAALSAVSPLAMAHSFPVESTQNSPHAVCALEILKLLREYCETVSAPCRDDPIVGELSVVLLGYLQY